MKERGPNGSFFFWVNLVECGRNENFLGKNLKKGVLLKEDEPLWAMGLGLLLLATIKPGASSLVHRSSPVAILDRRPSRD